MVAAAEEKVIRHYHGTPVWGAQSKVLRTAVAGAGAFVSFARPDQVKQCFAFADKVAFDNGAFSAWKQGIVIDWDAFYKWVWQWYWHPKLEFFVIPDTVEGGERENDELIGHLPAIVRDKAAPVWHLHESLERLKRLAGEWPRICLGSSGDFAAIRTDRWHRRMDQAFELVSGMRNPPMVHGLRMLDGRVMGNYPLTTADSTNLACNVPKTEKKYPELTRQFRSIGCDEDQVKINRCAVLKAQIEKIEPPPLTEWARQKGFYVPRNFKVKKEETMMPETKRVRRSAQPTTAPRQRAVRLFNGDSVEVLRQLPDNSIDSVVCDPPYGLSKEPDMAEVMRHWLAGDDYKHKGGGFMGKSWDSFVPGPAIWRECLRVLKPGGHLLAFFGSRTYDMGTLAIRLAGFEIRDQIMWVYGSGFPKSLDVSKSIDKMRTEDVEPVRVICRVVRAAMDSLRLRSKDLVAHFDGCHPRLIDHWAARDTDSQPALPTWEQWQVLRDVLNISVAYDDEVWRLNGRKGQAGDVWQSAELIAIDIRMNEASGIVSAGRNERVKVERKIKAPNSVAAEQWHGWGTALKPAHEPICVARKPLAGTVAANVLAHGTGGLNIDGCRVKDGTETGAAKPEYKANNANEGYGAGMGGGDWENTKGRWPANFVHDGISEEWSRYFYCAKASKADRNYGLSGKDHAPADLVDRKEGSAGMENPRAGAGRTSGSKNPHPTVKPIALMEWLVRLVTPPGGVVLDPFMGSGSTGIAAVKQQFKFVGVELSEDYFKVAQERITFARADR